MISDQRKLNHSDKGLKQQPTIDLMADQSVAGKTRFEKLDMSSVSPIPASREVQGARHKVK
jgi:hypothetical protein